MSSEHSFHHTEVFFNLFLKAVGRTWSTLERSQSCSLPLIILLPNVQALIHTAVLPNTISRTVLALFMTSTKETL